MNGSMVARDERTTAVENESYRWGYMVLAYGTLAITAYRAFALGDNTWEPLALVVLSGIVTTIYQGRQRVLSRRWVQAAVLSVVLAGVIAVLLGLRG